MRVVFRCDPAIEPELLRPIPARAALPDWLRAMPRTAFSDLHGQEVRTVKQCPPFVDAMSHGFIIPLPCDVTVHDGVLSWDWDHPALTVEAHPRSPVSFHVPAQVDGDAVLRSRSCDREVQQLLDDRARAGLFAVRHASGEPGGSAVPPVDRGRRLRPLHRCRHLVSRRLDGCEFRRRAAPRHARSRSASRSCARRSSFNSSLSRRKKRGATNPPRTRCSHIPAPIDGDFACGASDQASSERRSRAKSSQRRPFLADVSAWAMRPNVSGRSCIARR